MTTVSFVAGLVAAAGIPILPVFSGCGVATDEGWRDEIAEQAGNAFQRHALEPLVPRCMDRESRRLVRGLCR